MLPDSEWNKNSDSEVVLIRLINNSSIMKEPCLSFVRLVVHALGNTESCRQNICPSIPNKLLVGNEKLKDRASPIFIVAGRYLLVVIKFDICSPA